MTYNAASVLPPTLKSVAEQSFRDFEYLVIDGASSDDTLRLVDEAAIAGTVVWSEPDKGLYDAMNKAIDRAKGDYLIFLNAGDAFASAETLACIAEKAQERPVFCLQEAARGRGGDRLLHHNDGHLHAV